MMQAKTMVLILGAVAFSVVGQLFAPLSRAYGLTSLTFVLIPLAGVYVFGGGVSPSARCGHGSDRHRYRLPALWGLSDLCSSMRRPCNACGCITQRHRLYCRMLGRIKHKWLKRLYDRGDESGFSPHDVRKLRRILQRLDDAEEPEELDIPGFHFHRLRGERSDTFAVTVRANWRVTWRVDDDKSFVDVDYEDYH